MSAVIVTAAHSVSLEKRKNDCSYDSISAMKRRAADGACANAEENWAGVYVLPARILNRQDAKNAKMNIEWVERFLRVAFAGFAFFAVKIGWAGGDTLREAGAENCLRPLLLMPSPPPVAVAAPVIAPAGTSPPRARRRR
jgi:hypothetical protein